MTLVVLLGGARSGKSRLAVSLARTSGAEVTVIATAEPRDAEMAARIAEHRTERPEDWEVVEEPLALTGALAAVPSGRTVLVDCLSLWVANLLERGDRPEDVVALAARAATLSAHRSGLTLAVSNEVGLGIVPETPLGRAYRDLLGVVNRTWVETAADAVLVVAGRALPLSPVHELLTGTVRS